MEKNRVVPKALNEGDKIAVLAISRSLGGIMKQSGFTEVDIELGRQRLEAFGLEVAFGKHVMECNAHLTASIRSRVEDFHDAFSNPDINAVLAVSGGVGAIQMLRDIDYDLVRSNPKIFCGYSDTTVVSNALYVKTGLVSYYGPNFSSFFMKRGFEFTEQAFGKALFSNEPFSAVPAEHWSDDPWAADQENRDFLPNEGFWAINQGEAEGTVVGGSCYSVNILQGSEFFPALDGSVLFLESPGEGKGSLMALDKCIRALSFQKDFSKIRGIVIGRYGRSARIDRNNLTELLRTISGIPNIPILANVDFGHTTPVMTIPIGGRCMLKVDEKQASIEFTS